MNTMIPNRLPVSVARDVGIICEYVNSALESFSDNLSDVQRDASIINSTNKHIYKMRSASDKLLAPDGWVRVDEQMVNNAYLSLRDVASFLNELMDRPDGKLQEDISKIAGDMLSMSNFGTVDLFSEFTSANLVKMESILRNSGRLSESLADGFKSNISKDVVSEPSQSSVEPVPASEKGGHDLDNYYKTGVKPASKTISSTIEDVLEHARDRGVVLPKGHIEYMRVEIAVGKVTAAHLVDRIDKIADKLYEDGYQWHCNNTSTGHNMAVAFYMSKKRDAYGNDIEARTEISEQVNKETGKTIYVANRIDVNGNHHPLGTSVDNSAQSFRTLKNRIEAYYVSVVINELQGEKRAQAEQKAAPAAEKEQKPQTLEDVLEHARDRGVVLPKKHIEFMRTGLENGKVTPDYLISKVNKIAEKYYEKKPGWYTSIEADPNKPVAYYVSNYDQAHVYRRMNKETGEYFFSASRVEGVGAETKYHNLATAATFSEIQNRVEGYYVGIAIKDVAKENKAVKEQKAEPKTASQRVESTVPIGSGSGPEML